MIKKDLLFVVISFVFMLTCNELVMSQKKVELIPSQSQITLKGSSNLHEWEESVGKFNVVMNLRFKEKEVDGIDKVSVNMDSKSIVSENSIMTNKTHDALNVEKYPRIDFQLVSVNNLSSGNGKFSGTITGDITLSGVTKRISLPFTGSHSGDRISVKGTKQLNMTDFNIKPPTAMMGTLKTANEVTVSFDLNFQVS
ncbi:MAG TPA: YceI family protein [Bacteroidales bacterium]|nr:YceI family protein [Bacteroidales bacterium]